MTAAAQPYRRRSPGPDTDPVRDDPVVTDLVTRARNGERQSWDALVERYAPLVWSICRRHQLSDTDAHDVSQSVCLYLVGQLGHIRDPAALPGWLVTVTQRECLRVARGSLASGYLLDAETIPDEQARTAEQELLAAERHAALREAFSDLPPAVSDWSPCSPRTRPYRTLRSAPGWAFQSGASGRIAAAAWTSCAAILLLRP